MNILIVEDDPIMADAISMTLSDQEYYWVVANSIESALGEMKYGQIDGVLLDLNLPDGDGNRLARLIRARLKSQVPILIVSGKNTVDDRITALGAGADGYLTKPFDRYELMAHLEAIMRRANGHAASQIEVGNLSIDFARNMVLVDDKPLSLTRKEYQILHLLAMRKGTILNKDAFLNHLYGGVDEPESKIIDVFVCKLRRKLQKAGLSGTQIETIWGQGYVLRNQDNQAEKAKRAQLEDIAS